MRWSVGLLGAAAAASLVILPRAEAAPVTGGWTTTVALPGGETAIDVAAYAGFTYVVGTSVSPEDRADDLADDLAFLLTKIDADGSTAWTRSLGQTGSSSATAKVAAGSYGAAVLKQSPAGQWPGQLDTVATLQLVRPSGESAWTVDLPGWESGGVAVVDGVVAVSGSRAGANGLRRGVLRTYSLATGELIDKRVALEDVATGSGSRYQGVTAVGGDLAVLRTDELATAQGPASASFVQRLHVDGLGEVWTTEIAGVSPAIDALAGRIYTSGLDAGSDDIVVQATTAAGSLLWTTEVGPSRFYDWGDVTATPAGPVIAYGAGTYGDNGVVAYDTSGSWSWSDSGPDVALYRRVNVASGAWDAAAGLRIAGSLPDDARYDIDLGDFWVGQYLAMPKVGVALSRQRLRLDRRASASTGLTVTNEGSTPARFWVRGCQPKPGLTWVVRDHGVDVTAALRNATYRTPVLQPGESAVLNVSTAVAPGAPYGATRTCKLTAEQVAAPGTLVRTRLVVAVRRR